MKTFLLALLCCVVSFSSYSQTIQSFVPKGWKIFEQATGDLNKDSIDDVAVIIEKTSERVTDDENMRTLLILFKDKKNQYALECTADRGVILAADEGGAMGDPFSGMEIKKNVLKIDHFGGASEKWSTTHRYRYQNNAFHVIGATFGSDYGPENTVYDYNLSNGKMIITTKNLEDKSKNKTENKVQKIVLPELRRFEPAGVWAVMMGQGVKKEQCTLDDSGVGDCAHIIFSCGDFGNASLYLDQAGWDLWEDLVVSDKDDNVIPNPKYKGKKFEITYASEVGTVCEPQGEDTYQLVIGIKVLN